MRTLVAEVLAAWRRAERLSAELAEGTPEHAAAQSACQRLRELYGDLTASGLMGTVEEAEARVLLAELGSG
jgi:hypothetical protein